MTNQNDKDIVEKIKNNYVQKSVEQNKIEELIELDNKVKTPALIFAYTFGIIGALILGVGMCLAMEVIGNSMALGIVVGIVGIVMVAINYPLYVKILNKRKAKFADTIIKKSDELLND